MPNGERVLSAEFLAWLNETYTPDQVVFIQTPQGRTQLEGVYTYWQTNIQGRVAREEVARREAGVAPTSITLRDGRTVPVNWQLYGEGVDPLTQSPVQFYIPVPTAADLTPEMAIDLYQNIYVRDLTTGAFEQLWGKTDTWTAEYMPAVDYQDVYRKAVMGSVQAGLIEAGADVSWFDVPQIKEFVGTNVELLRAYLRDDPELAVSQIRDIISPPVTMEAEAAEVQDIFGQLATRFPETTVGARQLEKIQLMNPMYAKYKPLFETGEFTWEAPKTVLEETAKRLVERYETVAGAQAEMTPTQRMATIGGPPPKEVLSRAEKQRRAEARRWEQLAGQARLRPERRAVL